MHHSEYKQFIPFLESFFIQTRERERERERKKERDGDRDRDRQTDREREHLNEWSMNACISYCMYNVLLS